LFRPAFSAERGIGQKLVTLDDASVVTMNAGSRLTLSHAFNKNNRNVYLEGEAYFEVEKGAAPFVISAGEAVVKVVGTKFNVYARDGQVRLDVTEGVVELSTTIAGHQEVVRLHAGESSIVEDGKAPKAPEPNQLKDEKPLWMKDFFDFEAVPLKEVCKVLERRFDITILFASPDLDNELVEGSLTTNDLDATMNALVDLAGCTYRVTKDGVYMLELVE